MRPTMRFVAVKTEDQQARAMLFRTRQMFVGQRTQMINALRGHLAEHGLIAARGAAHLKQLIDALAVNDTALHIEVRELGRMYLEQIEGMNARVAELDAKMRSAAKKADLVRRAPTMPGVGPVTALAIETFAPDLTTFKRGRDFAAWLGLTSRNHSSGGKERLGKIMKMGDRYLRQLIVVGMTSRVRQVTNHPERADPWLTMLLQRKPARLATVAMANKNALIVWSLLSTDQEYRPRHTV
ncbi:transposase IS116/IS110/IS902 family protein [Tritonibacter scottomollicae]|uniref:Transposase IS116/IS110/IS902 family protein n=1 Tax=Tritonibacter scottomollicae TaxID=483013 RepID=A0A2T1A823_TRISK|nr:transposase IS116/IS110/IS902 family protein [Tritonibacter scottomollicae]